MRFRDDARAIITLFGTITIGLGIIYWPLLRHPSELRFFGIGDCWAYYGPTSYFVDRSIHDGIFPLWNPLVFLGQPIAGNPQYLLFYPPNLIRSVLTFDPTPWRTHVGLVVSHYLHILTAGAGTYVVGRKMSLSRAAAVGAGVAYTFSAALTHRMFGHLYIVQEVTWWPWTLFFLHYLMRAHKREPRRRAIVGLSITYALTILGGAPQLTFLIGISLAAYWILARAEDFVVVRWTRGDWGERLLYVKGDVIGGAIALAVAAVLSCALLATAFQLNQQTPRGTATSATFEAISTDPGWNLLQLLAVYTGGFNFSGIKTLSATGLIFCLAAFFLPRRPGLWPLVGLAAGLIWGSIERSPMHMLIVYLAPFPYGDASRGMIVAALPLALVAGIGLDTIRQTELASRARVVATVLTLGLGATICVAIASRPGKGYPGVSFEAYAWPVLAAAAVTAALWSTRVRPCSVALPLLLVLEAVDWRGTLMRRLDMGDDKIFAPITQSIADARPEFWRGNSRSTVVHPNVPLYQLEPQINGYDPVYLKGVTELIYSAIDLGVFQRGADALSMAITTKLNYLLFKRCFWLQRQYIDSEIAGNTPGFPVASTAYLSSPGPLSVRRVSSADAGNSLYTSDTERIVVTDRARTFTSKSHPTLEQPMVWASKMAVPWQHKTLALYLRSDCKVRLSIISREFEEGSENRVVAIFEAPATSGTVHRFEVPMPDLESMVIGLIAAFPDSEGSVTIERAELIVDRGDESDHILVVKRDANSVDVAVRDLPGPRVLSFIDFAYPGWRAFVDGKQVRLLRAFSDFKAVELPAGSHNVHFEFRPLSTYAAMAVSGFAWVACVGFLAWSFVNHRAQKAPNRGPRAHNKRARGNKNRIG